MLIGRVQRRRFARVLQTLALTLVAGTTLTSCSLSGMAFRQDHRMSITSPTELETVKLPLTVRWSMSDFTVAAPGSDDAPPDAGYYAVFVDRFPIPPNASLKDVVSTSSCDADPSCPSDELLAQQYNVYLTADESVTIPSVPVSQFRTESHTITIVLIDTSGRRLGESAWSTSFRVNADGTTS